MSVRLSVTIPDELNERLKAVKDKINVSKICTTGIEQAVKFEELKSSDLPEIEKLTIRIKEEMIKDKGEDQQRGFNDGIKDAVEFSYKDFKRFLHNLHTYKLYNLKNYESGYEDGIDTIFDELAPENTQIKRELEPNIDYAYEFGWMQGVFHVWGKVINKIKDERKGDDEN
jgi:hypothetical protein